MDKLMLEMITDIRDKLADLKSKVEVSGVLHEQNTKDLQEHMARTDLLEEKVELVRRNQAWWSITGKLLLVVVPIIGIILKLVLG